MSIWLMWAIWVNMVGSSPPSHPWITWGEGVQNVLLERSDKPEKRGLMQKWGVCHCFYDFTVQFNHIYVVWGKSKVPFLYYFLDLQSFEIAMQDFHPCSYPSLAVKPGIICTFLIHSGSLQKVLTALFNLFRNTQKSKWTISFLSSKARCFLVLKKF